MEAQDIKVTMEECPRCGGDACSNNEVQGNHFYICFGCGFSTTNHSTGDNIKSLRETLPQLYIDLEYKDDNGLYWYPYVMNNSGGMVFAEGESIDNWVWNAVPMDESINKPNLSKSKKFDQKDFMEALDYVGYFKSI